MDDLITDFIGETREMLAALSGEIVAWEAEPSDRARLDAIFRFVHTVKGNSGFFDLPRLTALAHAAEEALAEVRSGRRAADRALVDAVLAIIDRIAATVEALERGEEAGEGDDRALVTALSAAPQNAPPTPVAAAAPIRTVRLPVDLLDRMMSGVSDLVLARNELARHLRETAPGAEAEAAFERVSAAVAEMRDAVTRTRMQRIDTLFAALPRTVRDVSAELGKEVQLEVDGGGVELDREMIELIRDPLTHIVRNAIDHGIEGPSDRRASGKAAAGRLSVSARQSGNQILIQVADDGRGIDGARLASEAVAAGLLSRDEAARLTPARRHALIFAPGLSTARAVTAISGRGVGMDVVRANVERIGGLVEIDSREGEGVTVTLRVPLTLTIIPALVVGAGGQSYAIPRSAIDEIVRIGGVAAEVERIGGSALARVRGRLLPLISLADTLGCGSGAGDEMLVVLKPAGGGAYALGIETLFDHEELVVKPASPAVIAAGLYAGTTLAEDGRPMLLLDPTGIANAAGLPLQAEPAEPAPEPSDHRTRADQALLFRTFDGRCRAVPIHAVERIEEVAPAAVALSGGRLHVTLGEQLLPLLGCAAAPEARFRILRLSDGAAEIAYGFAEVVDIVALAGEILPAAQPGDVRGVTLAAGEQVELLDLFWLFESADAAARGKGRPLCLIPDGDPWMDNMLRPLIELAGYRVTRAGEPGAEAAEISIVNADAPQAQQAPAGGRVLTLRSSLEGPADSIHRYDRAALLSALAGRG